MDTAIFDRAAKEILNRGLASGHMIHPYNMSVCLVGALALADGMTPAELFEAEYDDLAVELREPLEAVRRAIADRAPEWTRGYAAATSMSAVYGYSDLHLDTKSDAVLLLNEAKRRAETPA